MSKMSATIEGKSTTNNNSNATNKDNKEDAEEDNGDGFTNMTPQQKKLFELRLKLVCKHTLSYSLCYICITALELIVLCRMNAERGTTMKWWRKINATTKKAETHNRDGGIQNQKVR